MGDLRDVGEMGVRYMEDSRDEGRRCGNEGYRGNEGRGL